MTDQQATQRELLRTFMEWASEEIWCAGWYSGLHGMLPKQNGCVYPDGPTFAELYEKSVRIAGGTWVWEWTENRVDSGPVFVEGAYEDVIKTDERVAE